MSEQVPFRKQILDLLIPYAEADERLVLLICDMGFGAVDKFVARFGDRVFNVGIMEQGTVGVAAGLALSGLRPVIYGMPNFLALRALEQVRNDIVLQDANVKLIANGVNDYFEFLGSSHCCGTDDRVIMELIGMPVYDPFEDTKQSFSELVQRWISDEKPGYLRV